MKLWHGLILVVATLMVIGGVVLLNNQYTAQQPQKQPAYKAPTTTPVPSPTPSLPTPTQPSYKPPVTPAPTQPSGLYDFYLQKAEYYQRYANTDLDMANMALSSANYHLQKANEYSDVPTYKTESVNTAFASMYRSEIEAYGSCMRDYQRHMQNYAYHQQMANEYLLKAQRELAR